MNTLWLVQATSIICMCTEMVQSRYKNTLLQNTLTGGMLWNKYMESKAGYCMVSHMSGQSNEQAQGKNRSN